MIANTVLIFAKTNPKCKIASDYVKIALMQLLYVLMNVKQIQYTKCRQFIFAFKPVKLVQQNVNSMKIQLVRNVLKHAVSVLINAEKSLHKLLKK